MGYKLDLKDKKLLYELDLNSRQSFGDIGKKIGLSKNSVKNRIDNMKQEVLIKQFHTVVDISKLGFISFRLYIKLRNVTSEKQNEIIEFLKKKDIVTWIVSIEGKYDLGALILAKTIKEMNLLWVELNSKYTNFIEDKLLTIMTKVRYFSRAFLKDLKVNDYEIEFVSEPLGDIEKQEIDDNDWKILKLLSSDARISIVDIASKLKLNEKTVISRIRKLEEKKIIIGYKTVFDLAKLGYFYYKVHFRLHNSSEQLIRQFKDYIKKQPNIVYDDEVLGGDDVEIELQVKDTNELREIIEDIKDKFGKMIVDYFVLLFYKEHKYLYLPVTG